LHSAFPEAIKVVGIDTSKEMVRLCLWSIATFDCASNSTLLLTNAKVAMAKCLSEHLKLLHPGGPTQVDKDFASHKWWKQTEYVVKKGERINAIQFLQGNAENTALPEQSFDLVTVMWAFHEAPMKGRTQILQEARRLLSPGGVLAVIDMSTDCVTSLTMLKGEPYVQEYQRNIHHQLRKTLGFKTLQYHTIVPNHLGMWTLTR
jgi:SAM-dependent methyltransferase